MLIPFWKKILSMIKGLGGEAPSPGNFAYGYCWAIRLQKLGFSHALPFWLNTQNCARFGSKISLSVICCDQDPLCPLPPNPRYATEDERRQCWPWNRSSDTTNLSKDAEARAHEPCKVRPHWHVAVQVDAEVAYWGGWCHLNTWTEPTASWYDRNRWRRRDGTNHMNSVFALKTVRVHPAGDMFDAAAKVAAERRWVVWSTPPVNLYVGVLVRRQTLALNGVDNVGRVHH